MWTAARLITHQVPLLGEQGVTHVHLNVVEIPVAALLAAETLLIGDILHLQSRKEEKTKHAVTVAIEGGIRPMGSKHRAGWGNRAVLEVLISDFQDPAWLDLCFFTPVKA